jgi:hypothetical protein
MQIFKKINSRRIAQRRAKRSRRQTETQNKKLQEQYKYYLNKRCTRQFGFCANPSKTKQNNFNYALKTQCIPIPSGQPTNFTYHNLCPNYKLPPGTRELLGLNLKFCLSSKSPHNKVSKTMLSMARIQHYLQQCNILPDSEYIKQLYIKNYNWHPPPAPPIIEDSLCAFENALKERKEKQLRCKNSTRANPNNLTTLQLNTLRALRQNKGLIIKPTDKNLGPAVMETSQYIKQVLQEHLLSKDYQELTQQEAIQKLGQVKSTLKEILTANANQLSKAENTFF